VPLEATAHNRQDQGITHQLAAGHDRLRFPAQIRTGLNLGPQQIARGEVQQLMGDSQALGLGAFTGPRGTEEEKALLHGGER
jgi:hypothetical protein